jgi:hypothetical protein
MMLTKSILLYQTIRINSYHLVKSKHSCTAKWFKYHSIDNNIPLFATLLSPYNKTFSTKTLNEKDNKNKGKSKVKQLNPKKGKPFNSEKSVKMSKRLIRGLKTKPKTKKRNRT